MNADVVEATPPEIAATVAPVATTAPIELPPDATAVPLPSSTPEPTATPSIASVYGLQCALCHGDDGLGTDQGPSLRHSAQFHPHDELVMFVRDGRRDMPAFADRLTDAQIDAVVLYVTGELVAEL